VAILAVMAILAIRDSVFGCGTAALRSIRIVCVFVRRYCYPIQNMFSLRTPLRLLLITMALSLLLSAAPNPGASARKEIVRGYLVDLVCVKEEAGKLPELGPNHTRKCLLMPACVQGGYAILLPSNEVLAFNDHGNDLARKFIASRHQEKGFTIKATGTRDGDHFHVLRIE